MQITLPENKQTEVYCLAAILNSIDAANEAFAKIDDSAFYYPEHKKIFSLFRECYQQAQACNLHTICVKLTEPEGNFNRNYILTIDSHAWSGMPYEEYFSDLLNLSCLRKSCYAAQELIVKASQSNAKYDQVIADHQNNILKTMGIQADTRKANEIYKEFKKEKSFPDYSLWKRDRLRRGLSTYEGVKCSYPILDATFGSFQNGALYYVGARTSMGKTTFILNLISKMLNNYRIGIFSLEMDASMIFEKLICIHTDLKYSKFSTGDFTDEEIQRVMSLEKFLDKETLFIEDQQALPISKLCARAKRMRNNYKIDILFIDYLTLIKSDGKFPTKHMQIDEVSKGLQALAKSIQIPVVCLAQLNRASIGSDGDRPTLAHFRESGSIEEDADGCILLHRPDYYNSNNNPGLIEVIVAKNRIMGTLKTIHFSCNSSQSDRYHELESVQKIIQNSQERSFQDEINVDV